MFGSIRRAFAATLLHVARLHNVGHSIPFQRGVMAGVLPAVAAAMENDSINIQNNEHDDDAGGGGSSNSSPAYVSPCVQ